MHVRQAATNLEVGTSVNDHVGHAIKTRVLGQTEVVIGGVQGHRPHGLTRLDYNEIR